MAYSSRRGPRGRQTSSTRRFRVRAFSGGAVTAGLMGGAGVLLARNKKVRRIVRRGTARIRRTLRNTKVGKSLRAKSFLKKAYGKKLPGFYTKNPRSKSAQRLVASRISRKTRGRVGPNTVRRLSKNVRRR